MPEEKYCNKCGNKLDFWDESHKFLIHRVLGYGSRHDGDVLRLRLCCKCMDDLIDSCYITPVSQDYT